MSEPWRNGMIENFNYRYQQIFLGKVFMTSQEELKSKSLMFEQRHNRRYRHSKVGGKPPLKALATTNVKLRFPQQDQDPRHQLEKPEIGRYHLIRFICRNLKLSIFLEIFSVPPELMLEYVVATIDVKEEK